MTFLVRFIFKFLAFMACIWLAEGKQTLTLSDISSIKKDCGYVLFQNNGGSQRIDSNEGEAFSEEEYDNVEHILRYEPNNVTVIITGENSVIELCGIVVKLGETNIAVGICLSFNNNNTEFKLFTYRGYYFVAAIESISCGSLKAPEDIDNYHCENKEWYFSQTAMRRSPEIPFWAETDGRIVRTYKDISCPSEDFCKPEELKPGVCAMLFREFNCQTCINKPIELTPEFKFDNSFSMLVKSLTVHKECTLYHGNEINFITFQSSQRFFDLTDYKNSRRFYWCECTPEFSNSVPMLQ